MAIVRETGVVAQVEGDEVVLRVEPADSSRCGSCHACSAAGACRQLRVANTQALAEGDAVTVQIALPARMMSALLLFAAPFGGLLAGWLVATGILRLVAPSHDGDAIPTLAAVAGFVATFVLAGWYDRRWRRRHGGVTIVRVDRRAGRPVNGENATSESS